MKKLLISILMVCLCLTSVFALASCENKKESTRVNTANITEPAIVDSNGFGYIIENSKTLTITQYKGTATEIQIPTEYEGKTVTAIGEGAFRKTEVSAVTIPDTIESIGIRAFSNCQKLTSITIADSVKVIDNNAFEYCYNLKSITLPSSLEKIGMYAFTGANIVSIDIPDKVTSIGHYAFFQCLSLESATIPESVTEFGMGIFNEDDKLTITCVEGSEAENYVKENDYKYTAE